MKKIFLILIGACFSTGIWAQDSESPTGNTVGDAPELEQETARVRPYMNLETRNPELETRNPEPGTLNPKPETRNFKPRYAGTSVDVGYMIMPRYGSGFYVAPKFRFQATPRFFVNTGISVVQYNPLPSQMKRESPQQRTVTGAYIFVEGMYLLNERWSVNGSVMKNTTPAPMRRASPYRMPSEAAHFGVDFKVTPNITVGARVGYSNHN